MGVLEADHLQQEKALHIQIKEMEHDKKQSEVAYLAKTQDFERLMTSRAHFTQAQCSLNIPLAGPDINDKISVQVKHIVRGDSNRIRPFSGNKSRKIALRSGLNKSS